MMYSCGILLCIKLVIQRYSSYSWLYLGLTEFEIQLVFFVISARGRQFSSALIYQLRQNLRSEIEEEDESET